MPSTGAAISIGEAPSAGEACADEAIAKLHAPSSVRHALPRRRLGPADSMSAVRRKALVPSGLAGAACSPLAAWWRPGGGLTPLTPAACPLDACRPRLRRRSYRRQARIDEPT